MVKDAFVVLSWFPTMIPVLQTFSCNLAIESKTIIEMSCYKKGLSNIFICTSAGLNISRMLGDKFLKEQEMHFSSEPYVSQVVQITKTCTAFALMAR